MRLLTMTLTAWCVLGIAMADASAQIITDYEVPPETLSGFFDRAAAVARGHVEQRRYDTTGRWQTSTTEYRVRLTEVLKSDNRLKIGDVVSVYRFGGMYQGRRNPDVSFREEFQPGDDLLLFLEWNPAQHVYMPMFGPDGSYKFESDGRTRAYGKSVVAREQAGKSREAVLAEVKKLKK